MEIKLYKNSSDKNVVDKSITLLSTYSNATLKEDSGLDELSIIINNNWENVDSINYAYITEFKRYYFVSQPIVLKGGRLELPLSIDPLMSLKEQFLQTTQLIGRQEFVQSKYQNDILLPLDVNNDITVLEFTQGSFNTDTATNNTRNFVLTVAGRN